VSFVVFGLNGQKNALTNEGIFLASTILRGAGLSAHGVLTGTWRPSRRFKHEDNSCQTEASPNYLGDCVSNHLDSLGCPRFLARFAVEGG
jgi:hypothetical protein